MKNKNSLPKNIIFNEESLSKTKKSLPKNIIFNEESSGIKQKSLPKNIIFNEEPWNKTKIHCLKIIFLMRNLGIKQKFIA